MGCDDDSHGSDRTKLVAAQAALSAEAGPVLGEEAQVEVVVTEVAYRMQIDWLPQYAPIVRTAAVVAFADLAAMVAAAEQRGAAAERERIATEAERRAVQLRDECQEGFAAGSLFSIADYARGSR